MPQGRSRGQIERRSNALRVVVYAGLDPVTGKRAYLRETIPGTDRAAERKANSAMARLIAQVDQQRTPRTSTRLGHVLDEFMRVSELEHTTRDSYEGFIRRLIKPALGDVPVAKLSAQHLESLYAQLRRCRLRCDGTPFIEHRTAGPHECQEVRHRRRRVHDCQAEGCRTLVRCRPHECRPLSASSIRQVHSIMSGTLSLAERWDWIAGNPARSAKRPRQKTPEPDPPSPAEAARLIDEAFAMDADWGTMVWLIMTTGIRRGEACALRFADLSIDAEDDGMVEIRRNYVRRAGLDVLKDPKTHQIRRIALDSETVLLLREHRDRVTARLANIGVPFPPEAFVFTGTKTPDHSAPCPPDSVTHRYKAMADRLGITTHIHALRHYSATELLAAGVDPARASPGRSCPTPIASWTTSTCCGNGSFSLTPRITVQVCGNGMTIARDALREIHLGGRLDEVVIRWSTTTQQAALDLVTRKAVDAVTTFLDRAYIDRTLAAIQAQAGVRIHDVPATIEHLSKELRFTADQQQTILDHFIDAGDRTAGGILHAVTSTAQTLPDADDAHTLERHALRALTLAATHQR